MRKTLLGFPRSSAPETHTLAVQGNKVCPYWRPRHVEICPVRLRVLVRDLTLRWLSVPMYFDFITPESRILIATLGIGKPGSQMFLIRTCMSALKHMTPSRKHTRGLYSSAFGSAYVSSKFVYLSMSENRLILKMCLASKGCPSKADNAKEASSTPRNSINIYLSCDRYGFIGRKIELDTHPLLLSFASSQGTKMSSCLIGAPFLENSLAIFTRSLSSLLLSMIGIPSTTNVLSKSSSKWTWYLRHHRKA